MIKLVVSDVDDTLLRNELSLELKQAVKLATESGIEFVLCSGRPTINLRKLAKEFNAFGASINYVAGFNGSEIIDLNSNLILTNNGFNNTEIIELANACKSIDIDYCIYSDTEVVTNNLNNEYAIYEAELNKLNLSPDDGSIASNKMLGLSNPCLTENKIKLLKGMFPDYQINKSKPFFIEITKPGVNKAMPVITLSDKLGVSFKECAVFGDGDNDIAMFELDDVSKYVVENCSDNLKKCADKVIPSVDDNGVAKQLMEMIR